MWSWLSNLFSSPPRLTLDEKLAILARGGFRIAAPFTIDEVVPVYDRAALEKPGFDRLLCQLGAEDQQPPHRHYCVNLWHFDTECIEDHGAYASIAERLREMAQGSLPIDNIQDHVDIEAGEAWLEFTFRGHAQRLTFRVDNDWVDEKVFTEFVGWLAAADPIRLYVYYDLRGQDCLIGCVTRREFAALQEAGVGFVPLT